MRRALLLGVIALILILPHLQKYAIPTGRDVGIFSYIGEQVVQGKLLYRDAWDSKGPLIFYLYAFAVALGGHSGLSV